MANRRTFLVTLYLTLSRLAAPLYRLMHFIRCRSGKDDPARSCEKFGIAGQARSTGRLVWVHAASVGETSSVLPLIEALTRAGPSVLLTTVTRTSAELAGKRLPEGAVHQYAPFDRPQHWERFLRSWRPDLAILVESEIWPACIENLASRACPICIVNGRMSEKSFKGWSRFSTSAEYLFGKVDLALAQSSADAERLVKLGCRKVEHPGNLKFDAVPETADPNDLLALIGALSGRPVWLAALTHPGEEEIVLQAHRVLLTGRPDLLLMLVPRHPARAAEISSLIKSLGFGVARRSTTGVINSETQVYLGDTLGEMSLFYSAANVVFLGGSFADVGGHNPVEAASFGSAILSGPKVANARPVYKSLWQEGGALRVEQPGQLADYVVRLLDDPAARDLQSKTARTVIEGGRGALQRTLDLLDPLLPISPSKGNEVER